jgi:hypothetical protein
VSFVLPVVAEVCFFGILAGNGSLAPGRVLQGTCSLTTEQMFSWRSQAFLRLGSGQADKLW